MTDGPVDDLLVVGAGPAGLATAIHAALAGLSVTVVESRATPIDKACGEGLMPGAVRALDALGVSPPGRPFHGIRYLDGARTAEARFTSGAGLGVRRTALHRAMHARALDLGVRFDAGRIRAVRQLPGGVDADGRRARYLVGADGLHSPVRALVGLDATARGAPRFGIRRHYACVPWTDLVEVHWSAHAEAYVTPVGEDLVGVAVLTRRGTGRFDEVLDALPDLRAHLADAAAAGPDLGAGPLRQDVPRRTAGRVLLVGDAAGYVDALTGEGIRLAIDQAGAAVAAITVEDPARYEREWRSITATYRRSTRALVAATGVPAVRRRLVPAAARFPGVFARAVDALGRPSRNDAASRDGQEPESRNDR